MAKQSLASQLAAKQPAIQRFASGGFPAQHAANGMVIVGYDDVGSPIMQDAGIAAQSGASTYNAVTHAANPPAAPAAAAPAAPTAAAGPFAMSGGLGPVSQSSAAGNATTGPSSNMQAINANNPNPAAGSNAIAAWGNVSQLPAYSAASQQAAFNLNLGQQQNQINQGYGTSGYTAGQAQNFTSALQNQALGNGPSLATAQLQQAQNQTLAQQLGAAAAQRGGNAAATQRGLMQSQAQSGQQLGQQAAITQIQQQQSLANAATNAQQAQTQQQALQQSYINQGMTAEQAQQQAAQAYMQYVTNQQQAASQQQLGLQQAQMAQQASLAGTAVTSQGQGVLGGLLGNLNPFKDGGIPGYKNGGAVSKSGSIEQKQPADRWGRMVGNQYAKGGAVDMDSPVAQKNGGAVPNVQRPSSLASALSKQIYPRIDSMPSFAKNAIHAADGNLAIQPITKLGGGEQQTLGTPSTPVNGPMAGASNAQTGMSLSDTLGNASDTLDNLQSGYKAASNLGSAISNLFADGGMPGYDDGGSIMSQPSNAQAGAGAEGTLVNIGKMVQDGMDIAAAAAANGGAMYAPSEMELKIARNLTRDVLMPKYSNGGIPDLIWRGAGIPETSESVVDTGPGIPKPVWRGAGIPETREGSVNGGGYGAVLMARRQLKK